MQNPLAMILRIISTVYMAANTYLEKRKHRLILMKMILRDSSLKADLKGNIYVSYFQMTFILMDVSSERL